MEKEFNIKYPLTVTAKDNIITYGDEPASNGVTYSGFKNGEDETALGGTLGYEYSYSQYGDVGDTYTITPKGLTSDNYKIIYVAGKLTVEPKEIGLNWSDTELTYTGEAQKPVAAATGLVNNDTCVVTVAGEQTDAGTYTATASGLSNGNYKLPADLTTQFTIAKAETTVTAPVAKEGLKASDTAQELVTAGKAEGGELFYVLGTDDKTAPTEGWSKDVPSAKDAGTYYVWYKAVGDKNHKDTVPACVKVTIAEKAQEEKPEEVITDPVTEKQEKVSEQVKETINDMPVSINIVASYPKAVEWTGKKVTKAQLEALLNDGESLAKLNITGLEEALKGRMKEGTDVSKLFGYSLSISKDKDVDATGYFTVKVKLNSKTVKKAKIKGADKKALTKLVKDLNDKLKDTKFEYKIAPLKLAEAESVNIRAKLKNGALQQDEQGNLTGLKSVKIKIKIKGVKKAKTFTYSAKKAAKLFKISITDPANKKADLTALEGTSFTGSMSGITVTK